MCLLEKGIHDVPFNQIASIRHENLCRLHLVAEDGHFNVAGLCESRRIHDAYNGIEDQATAHFEGSQSVHDIAGFRHPAGLNDNPVRFHPVQDFGDRSFQVRAGSATNTSARNFPNLYRRVLSGDNRTVQGDLSPFVDDDCRAAVRSPGLQDIQDGGGLSRTQKTGDNRDRDRFVVSMDRLPPCCLEPGKMTSRWTLSGIRVSPDIRRIRILFLGRNGTRLKLGKQVKRHCKNK